MSILWFGVLRPLYALGLPVAMALLGLVLAGGVSKDPEVTLPVIGGCVAYFALGYAVFVAMPRWLRRRLMASVKASRPANFSPAFEAVSILNNRYLGIDARQRQALFVDMDAGTKTTLDLDAISSWELVAQGRKPPLLTLSTAHANRPTLGLQLRRDESAAVSAQLSALMH